MSRSTRSENTPGPLSPDGTVLRSRDLAQLAGTTPRALRHYHQIGLLPEVARDPNGYRRYSAHDLVTVLRIRQLSRSGMPLRTIGRVLGREGQSQEELLAELDRELEEQADRIATQRGLLAELRRASAHPVWSSGTERPTVTQQLDADVWTLLMASSDIDAGTVTSLQDVLREEALPEHAADWYSDFERLETATDIDEEQADLLSERIADFADAVLDTSELTPASTELPVLALVEQIQTDVLSPAQQTVWRRFLALVERRWAAASDHAGDGAPRTRHDH